MKWRIVFRHLVYFVFTVLFFPSLSASTRELYNLAAIKAQLTLQAGDDPVSVTFARTDGQPSRCKVKLAVTVTGEVERNGATTGFYDEVVLRGGGKDHSLFAGDKSPNASWNNEPYHGVIKSKSVTVDVTPGDEIALSYLTRNARWNEGWARIESVKVMDSGCGSCPGGGGNVSNECVSLEISLGSQVSAEDTAGALRLKVDQPSAAAYTPAALQLVTGLYTINPALRTDFTNGIVPAMAVLNPAGELWKSGETLRQVLSPALLADIVPISTVKYEIRIYPRARVSGRAASGLFAVAGDPTDTLFRWTIENPEPAATPASQKVRITKASDCFAQTYNFEWVPTAQDWQLTRGRGAQAIQERRTKMSNGSVTSERLEILDALGAVVHEESETWHSTPSGERPVARTLGRGAHAKTTSYEYWPSASGANREGRLKRQTGPHGRWEYFHDYDAQGNVTKKVEQYLNNPFTGAWPDSANRVLETSRSFTAPLEERFDFNLGAFSTFGGGVTGRAWNRETEGALSYTVSDATGLTAPARTDAWLISPALDFAGTEAATLQFRSDREGTGGSPVFIQEVLVSTNYSGSGDPRAPGVVWHHLSGLGNYTDTSWRTSNKADLFNQTDGSGAPINLRVSEVYIAFRFEGHARKWRIDDIVVARSRRITENTSISLAGQFIAKTWSADITPVDDRSSPQAIEGRTVTTAVATDLAATTLESAGNRVTRREYYPKDAVSPGLPHQPKRTLNPDGTISLFEYEKTGVGGLITREWSGEANAANTAVTHGYLSIREENAQGHVIATRRHYVKSGVADLLIETMDATGFDAQNRPTTLIFGDGSTIERTYNCSGVKSETDREGVRTENKYDDHGRLYQTERWHGTVRESYVRYELDAAGRQTKEFRWGRAAGSEQLVRERSFHTSGELAWEIDALNRQIDHDESVDPVTGVVTHTHSLPGVATLIARAATR
ncbi:MAG: hypothetical protein Q8M02_03710 [Candidatus Didemnitutus sp.]|nr:hypothetical protein [Candidatus Didemnitutus sp.]